MGREGKIKAGVVLDDYKVEKYKAELEKAGFNDITITPHPDNWMKKRKLTVFVIYILPTQIDEVNAILTRCETIYKKTNKN